MCFVLLTCTLLFVLMFFQSWLALWSPHFGRESFSCICLFILHALLSVFSLFLFKVSGIGCGIWLWHSLDFCRFWEGIDGFRPNLHTYTCTLILIRSWSGLWHTIIGQFIRILFLLNIFFLSNKNRDIALHCHLHLISWEISYLQLIMGIYALCRRN